MFEKKEKRFVVKSTEGFRTGDLSVSVDRQTGVNYLAFVGMESSSFLPLLDRDGKPLADELPVEEPET